MWRLKTKGVKKVDCPECKHKRCYSRYVSDKGEIAPEEFGLCDRVNHCGYNKRPGREVKAREKLPPPIPTSYTKQAVVDKTLQYRQNRLYGHIKGNFGAQQTNRVFEDYIVGSSQHWEGSTLFWFKDIEQRFRGGMIVQYGENGKRVREPFPHNTWHHKATKNTKYNYNLCLYGEHLIPKYPEKVIAIVEAPKTCLIASLEWPQYLWIATNGLTTLQDYFLAPVKDRDVILFPDRQPDEFNDKTIRIKDYWKRQVPKIKKIARSVRVFEGLFDSEEGTDIADII